MEKNTIYQILGTWTFFKKRRAKAKLQKSGEYHQIFQNVHRRSQQRGKEGKKKKEPKQNLVGQNPFHQIPTDNTFERTASLNRIKKIQIRHITTTKQTNLSYY